MGHNDHLASSCLLLLEKKRRMYGFVMYNFFQDSNNIVSLATCTLKCPITMGRSNFLEPTLICKMRINVGDYLIIYYFCPNITNIQCVAQKSPWRLKGTPSVLDPHKFHIDKKINVTHTNYPHSDWHDYLVYFFCYEWLMKWHLAPHESSTSEVPEQ